MMNQMEMVDMKDMNIPVLSVKEFIWVMRETLLACYKNKIPFSMPKPPFLWGGIGIGKSQAIREIADELRKETGKEVIVIDVRLSTQSPVELQGLLMPSEDKKTTEYKPQKTYLFNGSEDVIYLLFYDEFTSAPPAVQAAAYEIVLDRKIGQLKFPDNVIIFAAGNRVNDKGVTYRMAKPLCNRMEHYEIRADYGSWREWAVQNAIHPLVIEYLDNHPEKLMIEEIREEDLAFRTPRAWQAVSLNMKLFYDEEQKYGFALRCKNAATIGNAEENEFRTWISSHAFLPTLKDILNGTCEVYPKKGDTLHAISNTLLEYIKRHIGSAKTEEKESGLTEIQMENICAYVNHFPVDFSAGFYKQLQEIPGMGVRLLRTGHYNYWLKKYGKMIKQARKHAEI